MDARDAENLYGTEYLKFDEKNMTLVYELYDEDEEEFEVEFPAKFEVCELCNGRGKHVNPSIDSHGLTYEDFDEDPDFRENYLSGMYDEPCYRCKGNRVEPVIDEEHLNEEQRGWLKELNRKRISDAQARAEDAYCRRMGF